MQLYFQEHKWIINKNTLNIKKPTPLEHVQVKNPVHNLPDVLS